MLVVGFDLDMTLIDPRVGVRASLDALAAETGVPIEADVVLGRLGPKLEDELAEWFPLADIPAMAQRYREIYWDACIGGGTTLLPGARATIDAVREAAGRVVIVTAKAEPHARRCLDEVGITCDAIAGHIHGAEKADALVDLKATMYVGDTIADIQAAVTARVIALGVATGMHDTEQLSAAGAAPVFASLTEFPKWFAADGSSRP
jgi:phosphoglycolate phosphatase